MNTTLAKTLRTATALIMLLALGMSFNHIAELAAIGGAGWERWVAPVLIDFVAILGKIGTGAQFNARTRRTGRRTLWVAGTLSLSANVAVGAVHRSTSGILIGAAVVIVGLWAENYLHGMGLKSTHTATAKTPAAKPAAKPQPTAEQRAKWAEAGRKAAATRKANAAKAKATPVILDVPAEVVPQGRYI
jgi:hypothetical protein